MISFADIQPQHLSETRHGYLRQKQGPVICSRRSSAPCRWARMGKVADDEFAAGGVLDMSRRVISAADIDGLSNRVDVRGRANIPVDVVNAVLQAKDDDVSAKSRSRSRAVAPVSKVLTQKSDDARGRAGGGHIGGGETGTHC